MGNGNRPRDLMASFTGGGLGGILTRAFGLILPSAQRNGSILTGG